MTSEDKPGWFGRLFGRKGKEEGKDESKDDVKDEAPPSSPEGEPDYATGAEDVSHVPLPRTKAPSTRPKAPTFSPSRRSPSRARARAVPEAEPVDAAAVLAHDAAEGPEREPEAKGWWSRLTSACADLVGPVRPGHRAVHQAQARCDDSRIWKTRSSRRISAWRPRCGSPKRSARGATRRESRRTRSAPSSPPRWSAPWSPWRSRSRSMPPRSRS